MLYGICLTVCSGHRVPSSMDTLISHVMRSTYHVHYGPRFEDTSLHRWYYIRGLFRHSVLDHIMHDPVFAACFCTAMEFNASDVLSNIVYGDGAESLVPAYMFYVRTLLLTSSSLLRSAHASCIWHTVTRVQFSSILDRMGTNIRLRLCTACMKVCRMVHIMDDTIMHITHKGTLLMGNFLHHMRSPSRIMFRLSCMATDIVDSAHIFSEGSGVQYIDHDTLSGYIQCGQSEAVMQNTNRYLYVDHLIKYDEEHVLPPVPANHIHLRLPLSIICAKTPVKEL